MTNEEVDNIILSKEKEILDMLISKYFWEMYTKETSSLIKEDIQQIIGEPKILSLDIITHKNPLKLALSFDGVVDEFILTIEESK